MINSLKRLAVLPLLIAFVLNSLHAQSSSHKAIDTILTDYFGIYAALVETDLPATQRAAAKTSATLAELTSTNTSLFTAEDIQRIHAIAETDDIEAARALFLKFSEQLVTLLELRGVGAVAAYQMRSECAKDFYPKEGAVWLQPTPEVRNPYWGAQMLTCGNPEAEFLPQDASY